MSGWLYLSPVTGWLSVISMLAAVVVGIALRRFKHTPAIVKRMRPHFWLGYAALVFAVAHMFATFPMMGHVAARGLDYATIALVAVGLQTGVGLSLRSGALRRPMRAAHLSLIAILAVTIVLHVLINGTML